MNTLRILLRNYSDFEHALGEQAVLFAAQHPDAHVELEAVGIHELYQEALTDGGLRDGRWDLALLVTDWLAEGMATGALEDLNPWHKRAPLPAWPEGWAKSLLRPVVFGEQLSSLPWHDGPECLVYRSDLFEDPVTRTAFHAEFGRELTIPTTWEEFESVARFFTHRSPGLYGTVFAGFPDGHNTLYDFAVQLWSRGGEMVDAAGHPWIRSQEAIEALDYYRRVVNDVSVCHPQSPQLDSTQSGDLFLAGEVAMMANWFGFATRASRAGSSLAGKVAIAPIPSKPGVKPISLTVFWSLAMGAGSPNKELAWDFLRFVASPERDLGITKHGAVGTRLSTWRDPSLQAAIPVYREVEGISLGARQLPTGPSMAAFASVIDEVMTRALTTLAPTEVILEEAQRQIESEAILFS